MTDKTCMNCRKKVNMLVMGSKGRYVCDECADQQELEELNRMVF